MRRIISILLLSLITIISVAIPIMADVPVTYVVASYSDGLSVQDGDLFVITYCYRENKGETAEIDFDASTITGQKGEIQFDPGDYEILDIRYEGFNKRIEKQGYAVTRYFTVEEDGVSAQIIIAIGDEQKRLLKSTYSNIIVKPEGSEAELTEAPREWDQSEEIQYRDYGDETFEDDVQNSQEVSQPETTQQEEPAQEEKVYVPREDYEDEVDEENLIEQANDQTETDKQKTTSTYQSRRTDEEKQQSVRIRLIGIIVMVFIGVIALFIINKKANF